MIDRIEAEREKLFLVKMSIQIYIYIYIFFFLISKNVIYTNGYCMHEEHRANLENTRRKTKKKKWKPIHKLITKRKRANERRERKATVQRRLMKEGYSSYKEGYIN